MHTRSAGTRVEGGTAVVTAAVAAVAAAAACCAHDVQHKCCGYHVHVNYLINIYALALVQPGRWCNLMQASGHFVNNIYIHTKCER